MAALLTRSPEFTALLESLGLPTKHVLHFQLVTKPDEIIHIEFKMALEEPAMREVADFLKRCSGNEATSSN